ncbi:MAG: MBL fold metallo-hydrolase, partial [Acidobacteriota bacterium]|nr:MBL fold metallo-hydrolase [Acidobacteriota bacterium]
MTTLTFYGGVGEIGGNKILLEDQETRIFLDFGMSFSLANKFFDEFMRPRKCNGLRDLMEFGLLPDLKGLYRCDYLEHCYSQPAEKANFAGVLLTHAHMDHSSYIHYLRKDIPIYCTQGSKDIMQALDETGATGTTELIQLKETFQTYINKNGEPSRLYGEKTKKDRIYHLIDKKTFRINNLEIEALPVSHSLEGATAYIIHSEKGPIVYTGDFRFHGYKGNLSKKFVERAAEVEPIALITEGTRIDSTRKDSEVDVKEKVREKVEKT